MKVHREFVAESHIGYLATYATSYTLHDEPYPLRNALKKYGRRGASEPQNVKIVPNMNGLLGGIALWRD